MSAATLPASPMVAEPYATPDRDPIHTIENGMHYVTRPLSWCRHAADRLTDADRRWLVAHTDDQGMRAGVLTREGKRAPRWADVRSAVLWSALRCTPADMRASELAWIDAVGEVTFTAAMLTIAAHPSMADR